MNREMRIFLSVSGYNVRGEGLASVGRGVVKRRSQMCWPQFKLSGFASVGAERHIPIHTLTFRSC